MVDGELHVEEVQSLKDLVEEAIEPAPRKCKKKKTGKDEVGPSKARERTPSLA
jgi:hypothetical protein